MLAACISFLRAVAKPYPDRPCHSYCRPRGKPANYQHRRDPRHRRRPGHLRRPNDIVKGWPKDISTLPRQREMDRGAGQGVYAESPNRVFMLFRGELPTSSGPQTKQLPTSARAFNPHRRLPWRDATVAALPGGGAGPARFPERPTDGWNGTVGIDAKWENCITIADATATSSSAGRSGTRSCSARISSPSIPMIRRNTSGSSTITCIEITNSRTMARNSSKHRTLRCGRRRHAFHRRPSSPGSRQHHVRRRRAQRTRVAKFDKNGKFLLDWGQKATTPDKRPRYMSNVHGIAVDPQTRRVFVNDRGDKRFRSSMRRQISL